VKGGGQPLLQGWQRLLFFSKNNGDKFKTENPEKDLMDLLVEKTISAGHMLSFQEASNDPEMVQPNNYAFYFGSFNEAARIAWLRAKPPNSNSDGLTEQGRKLAKALKETRQVTGKPYRREVNWMSEFKGSEHKGKGTRYTTEQVREKLIDFYERTGRLPKQSDIADSSNGLPSWPALVNHLGPKTGWQAIVDEQNTDSTPETEDCSSEITASYAPEEDNIEETSEGCGRDTKDDKKEPPTEDMTEPPQQGDQASTEDEDIKIYTSQQERDNVVTVDIKITLPDREKPVFITLTV